MPVRVSSMTGALPSGEARNVPLMHSMLRVLSHQRAATAKVRNTSLDAIRNYTPTAAVSTPGEAATFFPSS